VLKVSGGVAKRQAVKVGLVSSGKAEIVDGVVEGDSIVPGSAKTVTDGKPIRVGPAATVQK